MSKSQQRFSLSKFFRSILENGTATGYELDASNELSRSLSPAWKKQRGETGLLVPSTAFDSPVLTRDLTVGSGSPFVGQKVRQLAGVIGWSAVVNSGAQILGPFRNSDIMVYHDNPLPPVSWTAEIAAVTPADPGLVGTVLKPKRITALVSVSRQLLVQSTGSMPLDEFLMTRIKIACSSTLDQACLYGQGPSANQPTGIINTTGTNLVTTASPITWDDLANMRFQSTNYDASPESFGFITNPTGRKTFETTAKFAGGAISIWDTVQSETEVSKQVNDNRVFCGLWSYFCVATWGAGEDGTYAIDMVVDPFTQAVSGKVLITASFYCDVCARWPVLFSYTNANVVGP